MRNVPRAKPGIFRKLMQPLATAAAARRLRRRDADIEQRLAAFSPQDRRTIRAYLALNSGDELFIRALGKKQ